MTHQLGQTILAALATFDQCLNDPTGSGTGEGATPPDGDSYNSACEIIRSIIAEHRPTPAGAASDLVALLLANPRLEPALTHAAWTQGLDGQFAEALDVLKTDCVSIADHPSRER